MTRHTISVLVENKFGVLARIAGLFSGRGYNIHSLNVAPSQDPRFSRMTIVVREKEDVLDQIIKHLEKLVNTVEVVDFRNTDNVYRGLAGGTRPDWHSPALQEGKPCRGTDEVPIVPPGESYLPPYHAGG